MACLRRLQGEAPNPSAWLLWESMTANEYAYPVGELSKASDAWNLSAGLSLERERKAMRLWMLETRV